MGLRLILILLFSLFIQACGKIRAQQPIGSTTEALKIPKADLVVTATSFSPSTLIEDTALTFSATIKNQGKGAIPGGVAIRVAFLIDDSLVTYSTSTSSTLVAGDSLTLTAKDGLLGNATWLATQGTHVLKAKVDDLQGIPESDESNNESLPTTLTVLSKIPPVMAIHSDSFVDAIGVVAHMNLRGTIWETGKTIWRDRFIESGIRYARTQASGSALATESLTYLYNQGGVRANIRIDNRLTNGLLDTDLAGIQHDLNYVRDHVGLEKVLSFEGPNEYSDTKYDSTSPNYDPTGITNAWASQLRDFQTKLYSSVKADALLAPIPVLAPTIWRRIQTDFLALDDISAIADIGNLHYYTGGRKPTLFGNEGTQLPMSDAITFEQINTGPKNIWVTETGYDNSSGIAAKDTEPGTPEKTQAKYDLRLVADFFKRGVKRTFIYNFIDNAPLMHQEKGLLNYDLSPKPVFYGFKNLIKILDDKVLPDQLPYVPAGLRYSLTGDLTDVEQIVMQKRNGHFYVMLWLDAVSYLYNEVKIEDRLELDPKRSLNLDVTSHHFSSLKVYLPTALGIADPNLGALPVRTLANPGQLTIEVPDQLMIIELVP